MHLHLFLQLIEPLTTVKLNRQKSTAHLTPSGFSTVVFSKKGRKTLVEVVQNSGLQVATYGTEYTSAQRHKEDSGGFAVGCGTLYVKTIKIKTIIGKNGKAKATQVEGEGLTQTCKDNLVSDFSEQEFVPAFVEGKAIDSFYEEELFNHYKPW